MKLNSNTESIYRWTKLKRLLLGRFFNLWSQLFKRQLITVPRARVSMSWLAVILLFIPWTSVSMSLYFRMSWLAVVSLFIPWTRVSMSLYFRMSWLAIMLLFIPCIKVSPSSYFCMSWLAIRLDILRYKTLPNSDNVSKKFQDKKNWNFVETFCEFGKGQDKDQDNPAEWLDLNFRDRLATQSTGTWNLGSGTKPTC